MRYEVLENQLLGLFRSPDKWGCAYTDCLAHPRYPSNTLVHAFRLTRLWCCFCLLIAGAWSDPVSAGPSDTIFFDGFEASQDEEESSSFLTSTEFIYTDPDPIQTGVDPGDISAQRAAVLRGRVSDHSGAPLPDVTVSIRSNPQYGQTLTQSDGTFAFVVNGGSRLTVDYRAVGFLPVQRNITPPWQDYAWLPDVELIPIDSQVSVIDLDSAELQVAQGSPVDGPRGIRQPTLIIPANTGATAETVDGTPVPVSSLSLRATEYTVGATGPLRMPGNLPATSGYTHAVELSADEAGVEGSVEFSSPVYYYVENFLGFPTGQPVPTGYYDRQLGSWVASQNGRVIEIIDTSGGQASVDVDGDGTPDDPTVLDDLGFTDAELVQLASLYSSGASLWRTPIAHLTPWDCNWPYGPPEGAEGPPEDGPENQQGFKEDCSQSGSIIACETQRLSEVVPIVGTTLNLVYSSDRAPGFTRSMTASIPVTGESLPETKPLSATVLFDIAGTRNEFTIDSITPNLTQTFQWNGLDTFGRRVSGNQEGKATVSYTYPLEYYESEEAFDQSFAQLGTGVQIGGSKDGTELDVSRSWPFLLGINDARELGLGGWNIDVIHRYDPVSEELVLGNGNTRPAALVGLQEVSDERGIYLALTPDGKLLATETKHIFEIFPDGTRTIIAGRANGGSGDGTPALDARMSPGPLTVGPDGTIYFIDLSPPSRVRSIGPDGIVRAFAGKEDQSGYDGDGGPAADALLNQPKGIAMAPGGAVYISDSINHAIRRVGPNGTIHTFAGGNGAGSTGDGGSAILAKLRSPGPLVVGPDGTVFFSDNIGKLIRRITPDGEIRRLAGNNGFEFWTDDVPADQTPIQVQDLAIGPDGSLYLSSNGSTFSGGQTQYHHIVRRIRPNRIISRFAGTEMAPDVGDPGGLAKTTQLAQPLGLAITPDSSVFIADTGNERVVKVPGTQGKTILDDRTLVIASDTGSMLYEFNRNGVHLRTVDSITGRTLWQFEYDNEGNLAVVTDRAGQDTNFTLNPDDTVTITAPGGLQTQMMINSDGYASAITDPDDSTYAMVYSADGLLERFEDSFGNASVMTYASDGRLLTDSNRLGNPADLERVETENGYEVSYTNALGQTYVYGVEYPEDGSVVRSSTDPHGSTSANILEADGSFTAAYADGTTIKSTQAADPRWGVSNLFTDSVEIELPSGLRQELQTTRAAAPVNPANPDGPALLTYTAVLNGAQHQNTYDESQRTLTQTDPLGRETIAVFDTQGRLQSLTDDPDFASVEYSYDGLGRLDRIASGSRIESRIYDSNGWLQSRSNALGETTSYGYDGALRLTSARFPSGRQVAANYDSRGNPESITLPGGQIHRFEYSETDALTAYLPPGEAQGFRISQRADGSDLALTLPSGRSVTHDIGPTGRVEGRSYDEGTIAFSFVDNTPRIGAINWSPVSGEAQNLVMTHDGPLVTNATWDGAGSGGYTYRWNDDMRIAGITLNSNAEQALTYDLSGLKTAHGPFTYERNGPAGNVSRITDGVVAVELTYDTLGRLQSRRHTINDVEVALLSVSYDAADRVSETVLTQANSTRTRRYEYDADGQLTEVRDEVGIIESYAYDANGNRTARDIGASSESATYDSRDRLVNRGGLTYTVDVDGMLSDRDGDSFEYSARGELLSATVDGTAVNYSYDGRKRRTSRRIGTDRWTYLYGDLLNPLRVTASEDPVGALSEYYYDDGGQIYAMSRNGQFYYVVTDQRGSPLVVFDAAGTIVKQLERDAWGTVLSDSAPLFELQIDFIGGLHDPLTRLTTIGMRDYEPESGRFTILDPIWFRSGDFNLYGYAQNDPIGKFDPIGLFTIGGVIYIGPGGGGSVTVGWDNIAICLEGGFGAGSGLEFDPFGSPENSVSIDASLAAMLAGFGLETGFGYKVVECPDGTWALIPLKRIGAKVPGGYAGLDSNGNLQVKVTTDTGLGKDSATNTTKVKGAEAAAKIALQSCYTLF